MHAHTPTQNLWWWPKRPPSAFSVAEMSVAEMSEHHTTLLPYFYSIKL